MGEFRADYDHYMAERPVDFAEVVEDTGAEESHELVVKGSIMAAIMADCDYGDTVMLEPRDDVTPFHEVPKTDFYQFTDYR